jgi:hypothetical protein
MDASSSRPYVWLRMRIKRLGMTVRVWVEEARFGMERKILCVGI